MKGTLAEDIAALESAWRRFRPDSGRGTPLMASEHDQQPAGDHPYWEVVRRLPADDWMGVRVPKPVFLIGDDATNGELVARGLHAGALQCRFSWSIPSPSDLTWMTGLLDGRGVVEVGAGTGYWAWQLGQAGVKVAAYDLYPPGPENGYSTGGPYTEVAAEHPDRALLLVWPPRDSDMAAQTLAAYAGETLFLAAEMNDEVVADEEFFHQLATCWERVDEAPAHVPWWGFYCRLTAWRRSGC